MSGENTEKFTIDLDVGGFVSNANHALESIQHVGHEENLSGLIKGLGHIPLALGVVAAAMYALHTTMELVFDGEEIKAVNQQFEILSQAAGVVPEKLKEGMEHAAHGMMDTEEILKATNKALVELETGFERLPEVMELARKVASIMGGDVSERFEQINRAIASGQTRLLKNAGIFLDQKKVYLDYANSIGTTVDALSKAGQQQAMMNAVLDVGGAKFEGVNANLKETTNAWTQFKVAMHEVGESLALLTEKFAGPAFKAAFKSMKETFEALNIVLKKDMGEGMEQAENKLKYYGARIGVVRQEMIELQAVASRKKTLGMSGDEIASILSAQKKVGDLKTEYSKLIRESSKWLAAKKKLEEKHGTDHAEASKIDLQKQLENEAKFAADMAKLKADRNKQEAALDQEIIKKNESVETATKLYHKGLINDAQQFNATIAKLEADKIKIQSEAGKSLTKNQVVAETRAINDQIVALNKIKNMKMKVDDEDLWKAQERALNNHVNHSKGAASAIGATFKKMSATAGHDMATGIKMGEKATSAFASHTKNAFKSLGDGSKSASEAMGDAFTGMAGDMASEYGEIMFLASVWPPNPVGLAAGAALMALGGALGGMSGGTPSTSGGGGGYDYGSGGGKDTSLASNAQQTTNQKSVNLVIQGNMLGTDQSNRWLVDQVRNAADATDFKIQSIGGGL